MAQIKAHSAGAFGPVMLFDATSSTDDAPSFTLNTPCRFFSLQVEGASTSITVNLIGNINPSTSSTGAGLTLITFSSGTLGGVLSTESTGPISRVSGTFTGGASSGGMTAWFSAAP